MPKDNKQQHQKVVHKGQVTNVLYVYKRHAKQVKTILETHHLLDKAYRLTQVDPDCVSISTSDHDISNDNGGGCDSSTSELVAKCIAIPVVQECIVMLKQQQQQGENDSSIPSSSSSLFQLYNILNTNIVQSGKQSCLYSSSTLGNIHNIPKNETSQSTSSSNSNSISKEIHNDTKHEMSGMRSNSNNPNTRTITQQLLIDTIAQFFEMNKHEHPNSMMKIMEHNVDTTFECSKITCPAKLEIMGDDRTVVLPYKALNESIDMPFKQLIDDVLARNYNVTTATNDITSATCDDDDDDVNNNDSNNNTHKRRRRKEFYSLLWSNIGHTFHSSRIVRRGEINPNSKIRHSGHIILWRKDDTDTDTDTDTNFDINGPESKGWITITEQKIKQSFDLTKVMFSRGNISEKIRFGTLVQKDDVVLDMYAGIGYYTLPALVYGHAKCVVACEWNPDAIVALKYNLKQNGVYDRAIVLEGDSRVRLKEAVGRKVSGRDDIDYDNYNNRNETNMSRMRFDRISLGLLPSSEGGWRTAVRCLNRNKNGGGWLHIHGNVPVNEREKWCFWACQQIFKLYLETDEKEEACSDGYNHPFVICNHLEKVKSFAPKVDHLVADLFVGHVLPSEFNDVLPQILDETMANTQKKVGLVNSKREFHFFPQTVEAPSCALSGGILNQEWMMDK